MTFETLIVITQARPQLAVSCTVDWLKSYLECDNYQLTRRKASWDDHIMAKAVRILRRRGVLEQYTVQIDIVYFNALTAIRRSSR